VPPEWGRGREVRWNERLPERYFGDVDRRFGDREQRQRGIDRRRAKGSIDGNSAESIRAFGAGLE